MTIYKEFIERVESGEKFYIDFKNKNLRIGKEYIIKNGKFDPTKDLIKIRPDANLLLIIEYLYANYKYSIPSERNDKRKKRYFYALQLDEIPDEKLFKNFETREVAMAKLEGFILCSNLCGKLVWKEEYGNWFWQSKKDKDLIILKEWIN